MINSVADTSLALWKSTGRTRASAKGWISGNAVCCHHRGERADTRGRGGLMIGAGGEVTWHCFNCSFKASYVPGRHLNYSFRKLLSWMGASDNDIRRLGIEAMRAKELISPDSANKEEQRDIEFIPKGLPVGARSITDLASAPEVPKELLPQLLESVEYLVNDRGVTIGPGGYNFYITSDRTMAMNKRVIIPCYWRGKLVGYTARTTPSHDSVKPKYINQYDSNYVFNVDRQRHDSKFVLVSEGPFEAMSVDGVSLMGKEITEQKADIIESLGKEIIVVPQAEKSSATLVDGAIEFGWNVSFPVWLETCKDMDEAVRRYGKLFVIKSILDATEHTRVKIELLKRRYVSG